MSPESDFQFVWVNIRGHILRVLEPKLDYELTLIEVCEVPREFQVFFTAPFPFSVLWVNLHFHVREASAVDECRASLDLRQISWLPHKLVEAYDGLAVEADFMDPGERPLHCFVHIFLDFELHDDLCTVEVDDDFLAQLQCLVNR